MKASRAWQFPYKTYPVIFYSSAYGFLDVDEERREGKRREEKRREEKRREEKRREEVMGRERRGGARREERRRGEERGEREKRGEERREISFGNKQKYPFFARDWLLSLSISHIGPW
jgi:hypothetical protein